MTKLCNTCEYLRYCARSGIEDVGCDRYKMDTTTNEEWFCSLSTEEKAKWFTAKAGWIMRMNQSNNPKKLWFEWLKEEHKK